MWRCALADLSRSLPSSRNRNADQAEDGNRHCASSRIVTIAQQQQENSSDHQDDANDET